ncbi:MAG: sugar transferase, partial [Fimbriimonas ginsengisoli]|nr:sugar transferase [Fimbriimonas ginsengisoli]
MLATPKRVSYAFCKRLVDLVGAAVLLVLLSPLLLVLVLVVKLTSRGPVFYRSKRVGLAGRPFEFFKFRTMVLGAEDKLEDLLEQNEKEGPIFKIRHDPRVTAIGHFLRKYSLDELPQLLLVLTGEMSLVGPRP